MCSMQRGSRPRCALLPSSSLGPAKGGRREGRDAAGVEAAGTPPQPPPSLPPPPLPPPQQQPQQPVPRCHPPWIVNVLPLPVWPKAKMQALKPARKADARGRPAASKTSSWLASVSPTQLKLNECLPTETVLPSLTLVTVLPPEPTPPPPPRTRQNTRILRSSRSEELPSILSPGRPQQRRTWNKQIITMLDVSLAALSLCDKLCHKNCVQYPAQLLIQLAS